MSGTCDPAFAEVRAAFAANFADRGEVGAAVCVRVGGRNVVDLAGGWADAERTRPWRTDTLVNVYSVGKAFVGLLALQLVDEGRIQLDTPIVEVWPEFGAVGKDAATVRHALCHRAGVPAIREPLTNADLWSWHRMTDALAATAPWWEPGTAHAYHTNTYGHLVGGIVHRATGDLPSVRLRRVTERVRADVWFGVPGPERHRCADVIWDPSRPMPTGIDPDQLEGDARMLLLGYVNPPGYSSAGVVNSYEWRRAEIPSTNGHATAGGIAAIYAALLEPGRLLPPDLLSEATRVQSEGWCPVLAEDSRFGLGFKPTVAHRPFGPNPNSFGHFGTGGAVGFADPDADVAFGYAMNHVIPRWQSTRNRSLIDAVYRCL
jgi:CubicO group peptidase (beta-lactamase class C family)